jgi:hypothetical protein
MAISKQTSIGGYSFEGTFRVAVEDSRRKGPRGSDYLRTSVVFYVEGYLSKGWAADHLVTRVNEILDKWHRFENADKEFRLRNKNLWPKALRALAN